MIISTLLSVLREPALQLHVSLMSNVVSGCSSSQDCCIASEQSLYWPAYLNFLTN